MSGWDWIGYYLSVALAIWFVWQGHDNTLPNLIFYCSLAVVIMVRAEGQRTRTTLEAVARGKSSR